MTDPHRSIQGLKRNYGIYLAAPFFNTVQREIVTEICKILEEGQVSHYSPMHVSLCPPGAPKEVRERAFSNNFTAIKRCQVMLAVLEFALPPGASLNICEVGPCLEESSILGEVKIPDTGTVWEMGAAFAIRKPVVGLRFHFPDKVNLMLMEGIEGTLMGYEGLREFIKYWHRRRIFNYNAMQSVRSRVE